MVCELYLEKQNRQVVFFLNIDSRVPNPESWWEVMEWSPRIQYLLQVPAVLGIPALGWVWGIDKMRSRSQTWPPLHLCCRWQSTRGRAGPGPRFGSFLWYHSPYAAHHVYIWRLVYPQGKLKTILNVRYVKFFRTVNIYLPHMQAFLIHMKHMWAYISCKSREAKQAPRAWSFEVTKPFWAWTNETTP